MSNRLIVVSDVHHDVERLTALLPVINTADYFVFCGDGINDVMNVRGSIVPPLVCVKGNNDFNTHILERACVTIGDKRVLVVHGHKHDARRGVFSLVSAAKANDCELVLFGHTHERCDGETCGVRLINPGALCNGSYADILINGNDVTCTHKRI